MEVIDCYEVPSMFLYKCDPDKNKKCKKTMCQNECFMTTKRKYRADDQKYYIDSMTGELKPWNH